MPTPTDALHAAMRLHQAGQLALAEQQYQQILQREPQLADAHHLLGVLLSQTGRAKQALDRIQQAISLQPNTAVFHLNLGNACLELGHHAEAIAAYRQALTLYPDYVDALVNLGAVLRRERQYAASEQQLRCALRLRPSSALAHFHLGTTLQRLGRFDEAIAHLREALHRQPHYPDAEHNLGVTLRKSGRLDEALTHYQKRLARNPDATEHLINLGHVYTRLGQLDQALKRFEQALALQPDSPEAHTNRGILWLLRGDYSQGWAEYEWRLQQKNASAPRWPQPRWDGSLKPEEALVLSVEQGVGDILQFIRYMPRVKERVGSVYLACRQPLIPLLSRCRGIDRLIAEGDTVPPVDLQAPLLSLPYILGTTLDNLPRQVPYLEADPNLSNHWKARLAVYPGLKVGLVWQGNPEHPDDAFRSLPLQQLEPLLGIPGVHYFSLQKGDGAEQLDALPAGSLIDWSAELDEGTGAFMDTAALLRHLDLLITVDTAIAHLAGGLGVRTWLMLAAVPDWRWLLDREDSPWYPTLRIFRQTTPGDWGPVVACLRTALEREMAGRGRLVMQRTEDNDNMQDVPEPQPNSIGIPTPSIPSPKSLGVSIQVPIAVGELIDKITILQIKQERIADPAKKRNVARELEALRTVRDAAIPTSAQLTQLTAQLRTVNEKLWEIEDAIRDCERAQEFAERFISLARSVYHTNDRRAALKRQINELLGSELIEEKSYQPYT